MLDKMQLIIEHTCIDGIILDLEILELVLQHKRKIIQTEHIDNIMVHDEIEYEKF